MRNMPQSARRRWSTLGLFCAFTPLGALAAQRPSTWPTFQVGLVSQGTRHSYEPGKLAGLTLPLRVVGPLEVVPGVDYIRTHISSENAICIIVQPPDECLNRPLKESVLYFHTSVTIGLTSGHVHPFLGGGMALAQSLGSRTRGEKRSFLAPQLEGGLRLSTAIGVVSFSLRHRRLDRWSPYMEPGGHTAFVLSFRPGRGS